MIGQKDYRGSPPQILRGSLALAGDTGNHRFCWLSSTRLLFVALLPALAARAQGRAPIELMIVGAGHALLLGQCVTEMPGWKLVEPTAYLPR